MEKAMCPTCGEQHSNGIRLSTRSKKEMLGAELKQRGIEVQI